MIGRLKRDAEQGGGREREANSPRNAVGGVSGRERWKEE